MKEKYLNYYEKTGAFRLEDEARNTDGYAMVGYMDGKTAVAFTDFIRYQYPPFEKVIPTADTVGRIIGNLHRFIDFYREYVLEQSFEVMDDRSGLVVPPEELV